jgi:hypothetical protein
MRFPARPLKTCEPPRSFLTMPRKHTASFILELPLKTDPADERAGAIIRHAGRNIGNAVLGEGLRRLDLMRESRAYRAARKMSRGEPRSPERKARANEFKRLFEGFGFTGYALQKFAQRCRDKYWIRGRLLGHVAPRPRLPAPMSCRSSPRCAARSTGSWPKPSRTICAVMGVRPRPGRTRAPRVRTI